MNLILEITRENIEQVTALIRQQTNNPIVRRRREKNLSTSKLPVRKSEFWSQMVKMRLTSIQKSGPNSHVAKFNSKKPFPLDYGNLCDSNSPEKFIATALKSAGGIRFSQTISSQLAHNFDLLEYGEWTKALSECDRLLQAASPAIERQVANYVEDTFDGFGPKQSRNLLQALNLTRYEIPIDSRVADWLNRFGFPIKLNSKALADRHYYEFVTDCVQLLCAESNVYPCILDAAIFAIKDGDGWTAENIY